MKNKIILTLLCFFTLFGCGNTRKVTENWNDIGSGNVMLAKVDTFSQHQLDSMCTADKISKNLDEDWLASSVTDYSTKKMKTKYVYIKVLSSEKELIYTVYPYKNNLYIVNQRRTE